MFNREEADYAFTIKEGEVEDPLWLELEPRREPLSIARTGSLSLRLRPKVTMAEAEELARLLNRMVGTVAFTPDGV